MGRLKLFVFQVWNSELKDIFIISEKMGSLRPSNSLYQDAQLSQDNVPYRGGPQIPDLAVVKWTRHTEFQSLPLLRQTTLIIVLTIFISLNWNLIYETYIISQ